MTLKIKYHGGLEKSLPKEFRRTHKLHGNSVRDIVNYTDQFFDVKEWLKSASLDIAIGPDLTTATYLSLEQAVHCKLPSNAVVHIIPRAQGGITGAMLITALVTAAIGIAATLIANLLFPAPTTPTDTRKNHLYSNGLQTNKEGVALPAVYGKRVQCGGNVIEGDYDYSQSGGTNSILSDVASVITGGTAGGVDTDSSYVTDTITAYKSKGGGATISNTTYSDAILKMAMAIGAGEIGGIVGSTAAQKSTNIFIDKVPLLDPVSYQPNYHGFAWEERVGVAGQSALRLTTGTADSFTVGTELTQAQTTAVYNADGTVAYYGSGQLYIPKTVSGANINRVKLDFRINSLVYSDSKGNQSMTGVTFAADTKRATDAEWTPAGSWYVYEKSSQAFDRTFTITAPTGASGDTDPWLFRVYRTTPDSTDDYTQNSSTFQGYVEIIDKAYLYDGSEGVGFVPTALFACRMDLSSFSLTEKPEIALIVEGKKVRVPDVYDTTYRTYSGVWNGNWKYEATDNPVWNFLDLATDKANGVGLDDSSFDKFNLLTVAKRCDEQINGRFRYSLNKQYTDQQGGWAALQDLAKTFRAWPYYDGVNFLLVQDAPGTADHFINNSHVLDGKFSYTTTDADQQFNEVIVQWDNPDDYYRVAQERYQDTDDITRLRAQGISNNGIVTQTVYKTGCTNRQEAYDFARALVWSALNENDQITFTTSINSAAYHPGQRILVTDWNMDGKKWADRITAVSATTITFDAPMTFAANVDYDALLIVNNGMERRPIVRFATTTSTNVITIDTTDVVADTMISIIENSDTAAQPTEWRIIDIQETGQIEYEVTASRHIEGKFAWIDYNTPVPNTVWSQVQVVTPTPTGVIAKGYSYVDNVLGTRHGIDVAWDKINSDATGTSQAMALAGYKIQVLRPNSGTWQDVTTTTDNYCNILNCDPGDYWISVRSMNYIMKTSSPALLAFTLSNDGTSGIQAPVFDGAR